MLQTKKTRVIDPYEEPFGINEGPYIIDGIPNCYYQGTYCDHEGEYLKFQAYSPDVVVTTPDDELEEVDVYGDQFDKHVFEEFVETGY